MRFSRKAKGELEELIRFIAEDSPMRAVAFKRKLVSR